MRLIEFGDSICLECVLAGFPLRRAINHRHVETFIRSQNIVIRYHDTNVTIYAGISLH